MTTAFVHQVAVAEHVPTVITSLVAAARYQPGEYANVQRYGTGRVVKATAERVTLEFPDGSTRDFVSDAVKNA